MQFVGRPFPDRNSSAAKEISENGSLRPLRVVTVNPFTADPVKALHLSILV